MGQNTNINNNNQKNNNSNPTVYGLFNVAFIFIIAVVLVFFTFSIVLKVMINKNVFSSVSEYKEIMDVFLDVRALLYIILIFIFILLFKYKDSMIQGFFSRMESIKVKYRNAELEVNLGQKEIKRKEEAVTDEYMKARNITTDKKKYTYYDECEIRNPNLSIDSIAIEVLEMLYKNKRMYSTSFEEELSIKLGNKKLAETSIDMFKCFDLIEESDGIKEARTVTLTENGKNYIKSHMKGVD